MIKLGVIRKEKKDVIRKSKNNLHLWEMEIQIMLNAIREVKIK